MKNNFADFRVVEFSPSQKCFHVSNVLKMISSNIGVLRGQSISDYLCIGIFQSDNELQHFLDRAYKILEGRR